MAFVKLFLLLVLVGCINIAAAGKGAKEAKLASKCIAAADCPKPDKKTCEEVTPNKSRKQKNASAAEKFSVCFKKTKQDGHSAYLEPCFEKKKAPECNACCNGFALKSGVMGGILSKKGKCKCYYKPAGQKL